MQHVQMPVGALVGALVILIPAPYYFRAKNIGVASLISWLFVLNVMYAIDSILWAGHITTSVSVWCEICTYPGRIHTDDC
jgi:pheromone a factor receptor